MELRHLTYGMQSAKARAPKQLLGLPDGPRPLTILAPAELIRWRASDASLGLTGRPSGFLS